MTIPNPGVTPIPPTPKIELDRPEEGLGQKAPEQPFGLPKEAPGAPPGQVKGAGPMEMAKEGAQPLMTTEEMSERLNRINEKLEAAKQSIQGKSFSPEHENALGKLTDKMTPDMRTIAKSTGSEFTIPEKEHQTGILGYVANWIDGSQNAMRGAMDYMASKGMDTMNPADAMRMQYASQRSMQRVELFSSIVGATTSGLKTIMSTQLG